MFETRDLLVTTLTLASSAPVLTPLVLRLSRKWIGSNLVLGKILLWVIFLTGVGNLLFYIIDLLGDDPLQREIMARSWEYAKKNGITFQFFSFYMGLLIPTSAFLWSKKLRYVFVLAILSNFNSLMYTFVVFTTSLHRDLISDWSTNSYTLLLWNNGVDNLIIGGLVLSAILIAIQKTIFQPKSLDDNILDTF